MKLPHRLPFRRVDLPLKGDSTTGFLPWLVAPMVFLVALALSAAFTLDGMVERWNRDASGTLTVQLPPPPGTAAAATAQSHAWSGAALHILSTTPGVKEARALTDDQLAALLAPWLGTGDAVKNLPLPALIDVTVDSSAPPDLANLQKRLDAEVPGSIVDDHRVWLSRLIELSRSLAWLGEAVVLLIGAATIATVIYATRTGLALHRDTVAIMHIMGATNDFIARQFGERLFLLGLIGGAIGLALAVPLLLVFDHWASLSQGGLIGSVALTHGAWTSVILVPPAVALLAMATARLTVHGSLSRLP